MKAFTAIVLLSTSSNHSEEPECFNFLFDTLSLGAALILNFLDTNKHFTRNISVGRKKYQRRELCVDHAQTTPTFTNDHTDCLTISMFS